MNSKKNTSGFVKKNIILLIVLLAGILLLAFSVYYAKLETASEQRAYRLLNDSAEAQRVAHFSKMEFFFISRSACLLSDL